MGRSTPCFICPCSAVTYKYSKYSEGNKASWIQNLRRLSQISFLFAVFLHSSFAFRCTHLSIKEYQGIKNVALIAPLDKKNKCKLELLGSSHNFIAHKPASLSPYHYIFPKKRLLMKIPGNQSIFCLLPIQKHLHLGIPDIGFRVMSNSMRWENGYLITLWLASFKIIGKSKISSHRGTQPYRPYQQSMGEVPFIWL